MIVSECSELSMHPALCTFRGVWRLSSLFLVTVAVCGVTLSACGTSTGWFWDCNDPLNPAFAPDGTPNPCPHRDAGDPPPTDCTGECTPLPVAGFQREPVLLYLGDPDKVPQCRDIPRAPEFFAQGYVGFVAPSSCDECTCSDP